MLTLSLCFITLPSRSKEYRAPWWCSRFAGEISWAMVPKSKTKYANEPHYEQWGFERMGAQNSQINPGIRMRGIIVALYIFIDLLIYNKTKLKSHKRTAPQSSRGVTFSIIHPCILSLINHGKFPYLSWVPIKVSDSLSKTDQVATFPTRNDERYTLICNDNTSPHYDRFAY